MRRPILSFFVMLLLAVNSLSQVFAPNGHLLLPREPRPNLGQLKPRLIAYHDCKETYCYEPEIDRQCIRAIRYLDHRVKIDKSGAKLALILDIDETALSNWTYETQEDFAYVPRDFNEWVNQQRAPAISGVLRLYKEAISLGVVVFFITGRTESQRDATAKNLSDVGYEKWAGLVMKSSESPKSTIAFRSAERLKIVNEGYRIILSVGDQMSDLLGENQAELSIKLPNPFYYLP